MVKFFDFGGSHKNFLQPRTPYLVSSYGFGATDGKIAIFWCNKPWKSPKPWLRSKRFKSMTYSKMRFLRLKKFLGAAKN